MLCSCCLDSTNMFELSCLNILLATCTAQRMIAKGTIKVEKEELDDDGGIFVGVGAYVDQSSSVLLAQDQEILLPAFNKLAAAINNTTDRHGSITLCFQYIELSKEVLDMLLIDGPLRKLILQNNNLFENDGVDDFVSVVSKDSSLESINILNNLIKREEDAQSLVNTMIDHPKLKYIMLDSCGLGCNDSVMKSSGVWYCTRWDFTQKSSPHAPFSFFDVSTLPPTRLKTKPSSLQTTSFDLY